MSTKIKKGVIGALLNEYKNVLEDLKNNISDISDSELALIADTKTANKDCVSVQSILTHIILCGTYYLTMIDIHRGNVNSPWPSRIYYDTVDEYISALDKLFKNTVLFFEDVSNNEMAQFSPDKKLVTFWGQYYDYEQLMEHAIVHVSRHRRQIQMFKLKFNNK
ncbi:MAG TPA: DinB family protein [Ignavibacteria bacterium]|nr:DinB family protein [Ignavibacteria bacterium]